MSSTSTCESCQRARVLKEVVIDDVCIYYVCETCAEVLDDAA